MANLSHERSALGALKDSHLRQTMWERGEKRSLRDEGVVRQRDALLDSHCDDGRGEN